MFLNFVIFFSIFCKQVPQPLKNLDSFENSAFISNSNSQLNAAFINQY